MIIFANYAHHVYRLVAHPAVLVSALSPLMFPRSVLPHDTTTPRPCDLALASPQFTQMMEIKY